MYLTILIFKIRFRKVINICWYFWCFWQFWSTIWVLDGNQHGQRWFQLLSAPWCICCNFLSLLQVKNCSMLRLLRPYLFVESKNSLIFVQYPICVSCCPLHVHWPLNIDERCEYLQTWELGKWSIFFLFLLKAKCSLTSQYWRAVWISTNMRTPSAANSET